METTKEGLTLRDQVKKSEFERQARRIADEMSVAQQNYDRLPTMSPLLVFGPGDCFGERAMRDGKKRGGTIITMNDCHFAVVNKDAYDRLLRKD